MDRIERIERILDTTYGGMILMSIIILIIGLIIMKVLLAISKRLLHRSRLDPALHAFILMIIKIGLWVVLIITILSALNVPTAPLVTLLGATGDRKSVV